jgi:hypothetical protein
MSDTNRTGRSRGELLRDAALTLAAVLIAFAAFDDITTDTATTFKPEWFGLVVCATWLLLVSWRLQRGEHRWLGLCSVIVLVAAVGAGSTIRPGTGPFQIEYLVTIAGLLWFLASWGFWQVRRGGRPIITWPKATLARQGGLSVQSHGRAGRR